MVSDCMRSCPGRWGIRSIGHAACPLPGQKKKECAVSGTAANHANAETLEAWEENAAFWDEHMGDGNDWVEVLSWPACQRLLGLSIGERVLDVVCGDGMTSRRMAALGAEVVALDFSPETSARASTSSA